MDIYLGCIVEGRGEDRAVPLLLRRIAADLDPSIGLRTIVARHNRSTIVRTGELERAVQALSYKVGTQGGIIVLLDADDDQPCIIGPALLKRAQTARPDVRTRVVLAVREFEAWFLAAAESIAGKCRLSDALACPQQPEAIRDAKQWLTRNMDVGHSYSPTRHQPSLAAQIDLAAARNARSFDKFYRDVTTLIKEIKG